MLISLGRCAFLAFVFTVGQTHRVLAQDAPRSEALSRATSIWLSGGFGPSSFYSSGGVSARASATLSVGGVVAMGRMTGSIEGVDGHVDHREKSVLAGLRLGGKNFYLIPAIGIGHALWTDDLCTAHITCTPAEAAQFEDEGRVVAYDISVHATKLVAGVGLSLTGVAGSDKKNLLALVLSLELGWFGR
jgi:hypothetical protein